jgi:hypothetical protein
MSSTSQQVQGLACPRRSRYREGGLGPSADPQLYRAVLNETLALGDEDGLEPRVHSQTAENRTNVITNRFDRQSELLRDLPCRASVREQGQYLGLTRSQGRRHQNG